MNDNYFIPQYVSAPFTTVVNRAKMVDLTKDLRPRMGVERFQIQDIVLLPNEQGPNGEKVYKPVNDYSDQVRFVGNWEVLISNVGTHIRTIDTASYVEFTFLGKGANAVSAMDTQAGNSFSVALDGGSKPSVPYYGSPAILGKNYSPNQSFNCVADETFAVHTIKLAYEAGDYLRIYGFEVEGPESQIYVPAGKYQKGALEIERLAGGYTDYNTGIVGSKGASSIVELASDGSVSVKHTEVDATAKYLTNSDHSNEEVINSFSFRDFGSSRADDFSTLSSNSDRAFTLDDGTTTLVGNDLDVESSEKLRWVATGSFAILTFVGTGLDTFNTSDSSGMSMEVEVDGSVVGTGTGTIGGIGRIKLVSGLSYGTHTVKITRLDASGTAPRLSDFWIYKPKKPSLPAGAIEIADYNVMADFIANTVQDREAIATGVLRKLNTREFLYKGTWGSMALDVASLSGWDSGTTTATSYIERRFYGTGFEFRFDAASGTSNSTVTVDGSSNLSSFTTSVYGGTATFTAATGVIGGDAAPNSGIEVSGLTLGYHTVRITQNTTIFLYPRAFDIITPISAPKFLRQVYQNGFLVGNESISDSRELEKPLPVVSKSKGVTSGPTTSSTTNIPVHELITKIRTSKKTSYLDISFQINNHRNGGGSSFFALFLNGKQIDHTFQITHATNGYTDVITGSKKIPVTIGDHSVMMIWNTEGGVGTLSSTQRSLNVTEVKE